MFNISQPDRPEQTEDGIPLYYRTQPKRQARPPKFYSVHQMVSAMRLYRAARAGDIPQSVGIGELYDYVFYDTNDLVSKHAMGASVVHSVLYEPRLMRNTNDTGPMMTYQFRTISDLIYGLEWQICAPLYHWFEMNRDWPSDITEWKPKMTSTLDEIANSREKDYVGLYEDPMISDSDRLLFKEPNWRDIWNKNPERVPPEVQRDRIQQKPRKPPREI